MLEHVITKLLRAGRERSWRDNLKKTEIVQSAAFLSLMMGSMMDGGNNLVVVRRRLSLYMAYFLVHSLAVAS